MIEFYEHGVFPKGILPNVLASVFTAAVLFSFLWAQKKKKKRLKLVLGYALFLFFPNPAYLFLEIRHVLFQDNIADGGEPVAVIGFVLISVIGMLFVVGITLVAVTEIDKLKDNPQTFIVLLSLFSAYGAALGLMDLTSLVGAYSPWLIVNYSIRILSSVDWLTFVILLGTILSVITLFVWRVDVELDKKKEKLN